MLLFSVFLCTAVTVIIEPSFAKVWEYPLPEHLQDCYNRARGVNINEFVGSVYSWLCEEKAAMGDSVQMSTNSTDSSAASYIARLASKAYGLGKSKRQAPLPPCVRREYRMLTANQRQRFHNAVNALKRDTSIPPNRYDAIAEIHSGVSSSNDRAHGGPAFLSWHRLYLRLFEIALRQVDPSVCLPYWDSSLDDQLPNPLLSSIWTPEFLGTRQGEVVEGPCAGWKHPRGAPLTRSVGADGDLMTTQLINDIMTRRRYEDIVRSDKPIPQRYDLEIQHGSVHMYVGGTMSTLRTAAYELAFFLHHSFIDYLFQRFRNRLRDIGVDPTIYPDVPTTSSHLGTAPSGLFSLPQSGGYSATVENYVSYEPVPTCNATSPTCGGRFLTCQRGRCLPTTISTPRRTKRATSMNDQNDDCQSSSFLHSPVQNDYCVDDSCDFLNWAFVPVRIVNVRPTKFGAYQSYPVQNGRVDKKLDIYSPAAYNDTRMFIENRKGDPMTYNRCKKDTASGKVFVYSHGLSYVGKYSEYAIVDQRQPVSVTVGYVGIKRPIGRETVTAVIRAHDSCGRVCRVTCKNPNRDEFRECSGAIAISNESPLMYCINFNNAVMDVFHYRPDNLNPTLDTTHMLLGIYCDYGKTFPYSSTDSKKTIYENDRTRILG